MTTSNDTVFECSFCGKTQREVFCLIAGPRVYVCDECVGHCHKIVAKRRRAVGNMPSTAPNPSSATELAAAIEASLQLQARAEAAVREAERELRAAREVFGITPAPRQQVEGIISIDVPAPAHPSSEK